MTSDLNLSVAFYFEIGIVISQPGATLTPSLVTDTVLCSLQVREMSSPAVLLHLFRSHPPFTPHLSFPGTWSTSLTSNPSLIIKLHLSFSCHLWVALHIIFVTALSPSNRPLSLSLRKASGRWGGLFETVVCSPHQPQLRGSDQGKSRSSNPESLRLTSDKLWFHLPQREQCLKL